MKPGYSLLELTIGIFLASMLAITLFQSVRNTTTTVELADDIMDLDMRVAIFHNQFARDTIGIFVPEQFPQEAPLQEAVKQPLKPGEKTSESTQETKPEAEQKPLKLPDKLFYSINEQGQLSEFTFITANPVSVYEKATNVTVKPRMVRVQYRLLPDEQHENAFTLYRQEVDSLEASALDKKAATSVRMYPLLHNIKKMTLSFSFPESYSAEASKDEVGKPTSKDQGGMPTKPAGQEVSKKTAQMTVEKITTLNDWPFKTVEEAQEKKAPLYPQTITAKLTLWDSPRLSERSFTLVYPIASFTLLGKKKRKRKKQAARPVQDKQVEKIDLSLILTPKTEEHLTQLGEQVFKLTLESKVQTPKTTHTAVKEFVLKQDELIKIQKSAS